VLLSRKTRFRSLIGRHLGFLRRAVPGTSGRAQKSMEGGGGENRYLFAPPAPLPPRRLFVNYRSPRSPASRIFQNGGQDSELRVFSPKKNSNAYRYLGIRDLAKIRCGIPENAKYLDGIRDLTVTREAGFAKIWARDTRCFCLTVGNSGNRLDPSKRSSGKSESTRRVQNINRRGQYTS